MYLNLSGLMRVDMNNIRGNFRWKRPSTKRVASWYATSDCTLL